MRRSRNLPTSVEERVNWLQTRTIKTPLRSREASTERTLEKGAVDLSDEPKD
jgi:hypothetical protein